MDVRVDNAWEQQLPGSIDLGPATWKSAIVSNSHDYPIIYGDPAVQDSI
jgi:hypothetical protein